MSRSHCLEIFSCLENPSLQLFRKMYFIISFLCLLSFESFLEKISFEKMVFLKKTKLLLSPLDFCSIFFLRAKTLFYFSIVLLIFCVCVFLFFLFLFGFFLVFFDLFCWICPNKNLLKKISFENILVFTQKKCLLNLFWRREHILIRKRMCSNVIIRIFLKKKISLKRKKNLFQNSHALRIPCAIESPLDHCCVSWRSWASPVHVHSVVIDLGRGHLLHQAISHPDSVFFQKKKRKEKKAPCEKNVMQMSFFTLLFFFQFFEHFSDFFASIVLQNQKFHGRNRFFLFSPPCFYSHVSCPFCLSLCFCQGDLIAEDKTRHQEKWVKPMVGMVNKVWKGGLLLACFFNMTEGLSWWTRINQRECLGWWFLATLGSNSVFLVIEWLVCDTDSPRDTPASECLSLSPYVHVFEKQFFSFSLSPFLLSLCLPSFLNTWHKVTGKIGQLEAAKLNLEDQMVGVEDQKKTVLEKQTFVEKQLNGLKEETSKLADTFTAALVIYEEHMRDYHATRLGRRTSPTILQERICQITGTRWMHPCNVLEWK